MYVHNDGSLCVQSMSIKETVNQEMVYTVLRRRFRYSITLVLKIKTLDDKPSEIYFRVAKYQVGQLTRC